MFDEFGFETLTAPQAAAYLALILGFAFGLCAQISRFCLRRAIVGDDTRQTQGVWSMALLTALIGTQAAQAYGYLDLSEHRFFVTDMPVLAIVTGGLMFGAGMVLTRGCLSRLVVLGASGNLRATLVLLVAALTALATLRGVLAPLRQGLSAYTIPLSETALPLIAGGVIALAAIWLIFRSGAGIVSLILAALIGLLVPLGWVGTGYVLYSDFDAVTVQSLSFTAPLADGLFYLSASSALSFGYGPALVVGAAVGAFLAAALRGELRWQSFDSPRQTGRYLLGAGLMGLGGVLAGGCTVGAGLSGLPTLSVSAATAVIAIVIGAKLTNAALNASSTEFAAASTTQAAPPAE